MPFIMISWTTLIYDERGRDWIRTSGNSVPSSKNIQTCRAIEKRKMVYMKEPCTV
jgi:hypothetical protein